jgi:hypothetical protein
VAENYLESLYKFTEEEEAKILYSKGAETKVEQVTRSQNLALKEY